MFYVIIMVFFGKYIFLILFLENGLLKRGFVKK
jgi:hypothetical protein